MRIESPLVRVETDCPPRVWVGPVYQTCVRRQWVEPVNQTVADRVWVDDATTTVCDRVYVPDRFCVRAVVVRDRRGRRYVHRETVLLARAHDEDRPRTVFVPGHFEDGPRRVPVADGYYREVAVRDVVTPAHYEEADDPGIAIRLPF